MKKISLVLALSSLFVLGACSDLSHENPESLVNSWNSVGSSMVARSNSEQSSIFAVSSLGASSSSLSASSSAKSIAGAPLTYVGQTYRTVVIGTRTWMAENLNVSPATGHSWCYGGVSQNCATYGRLYDWATAMTACPSGWHLPDTAEWTDLQASAGEATVAATALKAVSSLWNPNKGTDALGFSALPGGCSMCSASLTYEKIGEIGWWWTATEGSSGAFTRMISADSAFVGQGDVPKTVDLSVRCVKDALPTVATISSANGSSNAQLSSSALATGTPGAPLTYGGRTYGTVVMGTVTWMSENLNYIPTIGNSWCYDGQPSNCSTYGRLYDYPTAKTVCPSGWHLPDTSEWKALSTAAGGGSIASTRLKAISTLWSPNTGTDDFGFSALPGGGYLGIDFGDIGIYGNWWTTTASGSANAYSQGIGSNGTGVETNVGTQTFGFSVRCVKA